MVHMRISNVFQNISFRLSGIFLLLITVTITLSCSSAKIPKQELAKNRWEHIVFRSINRVTESVRVIPLRENPLNEGDVEVRIWRDSSDLEAVFLRLTNDKLSGVHIVNKDTREPDGKTSKDTLKAPKDGWNSLWNQLVELGLLKLPDNENEDCYALIDGTAYVVEISANGAYRTYHYPPGVPSCENSLQMDKISETIGIAFDDGEADCKSAEWFPCAKLLRKYRESRPTN